MLNAMKPLLARSRSQGTTWQTNSSKAPERRHLVERIKMDTLDKICRRSALISNKTSLRDDALRDARQCIKHASLAIRAIHRNEEPEARQELANGRSSSRACGESLRSRTPASIMPVIPGRFEGILRSRADRRHDPWRTLPTPEALGAEAPPTSTGWRKRWSELRRRCLDLLRRVTTVRWSVCLRLWTKFIHSWSRWTSPTRSRKACAVAPTWRAGSSNARVVTSLSLFGKNSWLKSSTVSRLSFLTSKADAQDQRLRTGDFSPIANAPGIIPARAKI